MEAHSHKASEGGLRLRLISLYARGFKKLNFKQSITFPQGIVLIRGPNESGKSTVLDAILYALYGRTLKSGPEPGHKELVGYGCEEAEVGLGFSVGETIYRVEREAHRNSARAARLFEVKPDGTRTALATTHAGTDVEIQRLLGGITFDEIVASTVIAQKDLEHLVKQRIDDRKQIINVFLNMESLNKLEDWIEDEQVKLEGTPNNPGRLSVENQTLQALMQQMNNYKDCEAQRASLATKIDNLKQDLEKYSREFEEADRRYSSLQQHREVLRLSKEVQSKAELEASLKAQLTSMAALRTELDHVKTQIKDYADLRGVEEVINQAANDLEKVGELEALHTRLFEQARQLQARTSSSGKSQSRQLMKRLDNSKDKLWIYLAPGAVLAGFSILSLFLDSLLAPALGTAAAAALALGAREFSIRTHEPKGARVTPNASTPVPKSQTSLEQLSKLISETNARSINQSTGVLKSLRSISRYSSDTERLDEPSALLEHARTFLNRDKQSLLLLEERAGILEMQIQEQDRVKRRLQDCRNEMDALGKKLQDIHGQPTETDLSEGVLEEAGRQRDSLNATISRVKTQIEESIIQWLEVNSSIEGDKKDIEERLDVQTRSVRLLENELTVLKYSAVGLERLSESLRNRVNPLVGYYMGRMLPVITSGRYRAVKLDDNYSTSVFDPEAGEFRPKEIFSGGMEDQVLLAMRLSFALALTPQRKERSPEFLFLDEPLESSDMARQESTFKLLKNELSKDFRQIFVMSHVGNLEFVPDAVIEMDNGVATEVINHPAPTIETIQLTH